ncbi:hypothetical protein [Streptomyces sp. NPDC001068]|uniref:hypothetical protein n=1 Tax=Streptomyces sp. NPDC001068 TaxID=3364544 RepID=UPI003676A743
MNTDHLERGWDDAVALFERRGLPESSYENLYEEPYDILPGPVTITGELDLDTAETSGTGIVVDGDLTVGGTVFNLDDGCPALVVLGDLRAANVYLEGDAKLLVLGSVLVDAFIGHTTDKLVMIHGDLRTRVTVLSGEFAPDLVGGTLHGAVLAPAYLDLAQDTDPASVLVPEVLRADGEECPRGFDAPRAHGGRLLSRLDEGLPVVLG